ncbi:MAG TPA: hypothetical protein VF777_13150 [Phycisphaerales bacterium]
MRASSRCACVVGGVLLASSASGQITLISDQRAVTVEAAGQVQFAFPTPPFANFNRDLTRDVPSGGGNGVARAQQTSSVSTSAMSASGLVRAESNAGPSNCILTQSTSDFRVLFSVPAIARCVVSGNVTGAQFRLGNNAEGTVALVESLDTTTLPIDITRVLRPGRVYTLLALASDLSSACNGGVIVQNGSYTISATFAAITPCPGDLNFDGFVDDADFTAFAGAYNELLCAPPPAFCDADLNSDSVVDDVDFVIFAASYNDLICPE